MYARVYVQSYGKTEHTKETNEDSSLASVERGLFAVADGVSTVLFSRRWANILTSHFERIPLLSNNPFEVEWWLGPAWEQYKQETGDITQLHWSLQKKAREGSAATLATLRITEMHETEVKAELLAFGDSCIFIDNEPTNDQIFVFPLQTTEEFNAAPICIPSLPRKFDRTFHRCKSDTVQLHSADMVILATDAVSKWIMSNGANTDDSRRAALDKVSVAAQTPSGWQEFITACRKHNEMVDDDATVVIVRLIDEQNVIDGSEAQLLGCTLKLDEGTIKQRRQDLDEAMQKGDKVALAIAYGDGNAFSDEPEELQQAKDVANTLSSVWQAFYQSLNHPDLHKRVKRVWDKYAALLRDEPCAEQLRQVLISNDILPVEYFRQDTSLTNEAEQALPADDTQDILLQEASTTSVTTESQSPTNLLEQVATQVSDNAAMSVEQQVPMDTTEQAAEQSLDAIDQQTVEQVQ